MERDRWTDVLMAVRRLAVSRPLRITELVVAQSLQILLKFLLISGQDIQYLTSAAS